MPLSLSYRNSRLISEWLTLSLYFEIVDITPLTHSPRQIEGLKRGPKLQHSNILG